MASKTTVPAFNVEITNKNLFSLTFRDEKLSSLGYVDGSVANTQLTINKVFVDPSLRGQGRASELMQHTFDWCMDNEMTIFPICSYAVYWLKKHPEQAKLVSSEKT